MSIITITVTNTFCSRHSADYLRCNISFNPHNNSVRYLPIIPILQIQRMRLKRTNNLPKITR